MKFEFLEHTADIKFKAYGSTLAVAFENAALAFSYFVSRGEKIKLVQEKNVEINGSDKENLLYTFLEELIFLLDAESFIVGSADVKIDGKKLRARLRGDASKNYNLDNVKAATYAEMRVENKKGIWEIQAVLDV